MIPEERDTATADDKSPPGICSCLRGGIVTPGSPCRRMLPCVGVRRPIAFPQAPPDMHNGLMRILVQLSIDSSLRQYSAVRYAISVGKGLLEVYPANQSRWPK